ncbi:MAG: transcriptional regulator, partial [Calditrichia bacterium]
LTADKLFLGVDGIHFRYGLTTPNMLEAKVNRLMMNAAAEVVLLADSSKFGRRSMGVISEIHFVDKIISDTGLPEETRIKLEEMGIIVFTE